MSAGSAGAGRRCGRGGYTLVILVVAIAVLSILLAAALPSWTTAVQREKEQELIFRGMQYAEAIRVYQERFGHLPTSLEELIRVRPRCIRRLWKDPMSKDGRWQLVVTPGETPVQPGQNSPPVGIRPGATVGGTVQSNGQAPSSGDVGEQSASGRATGLASGAGVVSGPIRGVYSSSSKKSLRSFNGETRYDRWLFTMDIVPMPTTRPETGAITRARSDWAGRPFDQGVTPQQGRAPSSSPTPVKSTDSESDS